MTLAELALLLDVEPKWILNTMAALGRPRKYSVSLARRLAVAHAIHRAVGSPLAESFAQAGQILRSYRGDVAPTVIPAGDNDVALLVDIHRILSSFGVRLSMLSTMYAPRQRGRHSSGRRDPLKAATEWGTDLTLLADNLGKTVEARVRQLDSMAAFAQGVRRPSPSAR